VQKKSSLNARMVEKKMIIWNSYAKLLLFSGQLAYEKVATQDMNLYVR